MAKSSFSAMTTWFGPTARLGSGGGDPELGPIPTQLWRITGSTLAWSEARRPSVDGSETMVRALEAPDGFRASISSSWLSARGGTGSDQTPTFWVEPRMG